MATVRRNLDRRIGRLPGVRAAVREVAAAVLDAALARAAKHRDSGTFAESLDIETGRTDARVVSSDPRAVSKEYGHVDKRTGQPVPGAHILSGAAADVAGR